MALASWIWLCAAVTPKQRSLKVGTLAQGLRLQILQSGLQRLISQIPDHVVVGRHSVVAEQLPQTDQGLRLGQPGGGNIRLKLQS